MLGVYLTAPGAVQWGSHRHDAQRSHLTSLCCARDSQYVWAMRSMKRDNVRRSDAIEACLNMAYNVANQGLTVFVLSPFAVEDHARWPRHEDGVSEAVLRRVLLKYGISAGSTSSLLCISGAVQVCKICIDFSHIFTCSTMPALLL